MEYAGREKTTLEKAAVIVSVVVPLIGVFVAIWTLWERLVGWREISIMVIGYVLTALGITIGFHRMLTHRSFEAHPVVRFLFLAFGSAALQGPCHEWASTHIKHHAHTDDDDDPHSPLHGFFHSHLGWLIAGDKPDLNTYGKWMLKDPLVMFMGRTWYVWFLLSMLVPYLLAGWTGVLWGGLVRVFLLNHVTWSVNSVCHTFGNKMFVTADQSRNNWLVGLLAMGEGWHNNHHAFPRSAFHGMRWYQFDLSSYTIWLMEKIGLAWNVHRVPSERLEARLNRSAAPVPNDIEIEIAPTGS
ncbi:MAG TPA: acyl-CoA desaturase [Roseiflexaceae bacterium]|nr:acyl-CoA desaturase [Roseiflexaceae bacterium]